MASEYTTNYKLDKYVGTDKPNLRDQYNAAMDKIDAQMLINSNAATTATTTANNVKTTVDDHTATITELHNSIDSAEGEIADLKTANETINTSISTLRTDVNGKAPMAHVASDTRFGVAQETLYGHVRLTDDYNNSNTGTAVSGAALQAALGGIRPKKLYDVDNCRLMNGDTVINTSQHVRIYWVDILDLLLVEVNSTITYTLPGNTTYTVNPPVGDKAVGTDGKLWQFSNIGITHGPAQRTGYGAAQMGYMAQLNINANLSGDISFKNDSSSDASGFSERVEFIAMFPETDPNIS